MNCIIRALSQAPGGRARHKNSNNGAVRRGSRWYLCDGWTPAIKHVFCRNYPARLPATKRARATKKTEKQRRCVFENRLRADKSANVNMGRDSRSFYTELRSPFGSVQGPLICAPWPDSIGSGSVRLRLFDCRAVHLWNRWNIDMVRLYLCFQRTNYPPNIWRKPSIKYTV